MTSTRNYIGSSFGSKLRLAISELRKYHYMFGMPYFDDTEEMGEFSNHSKGVSKIRSALNIGVLNVKKVYKISIAGKDITLFGLGLSGASGESRFMLIIDLGTPKHTAFLPYELLVVNGEVHMLHSRFRIALSFPDLTMTTFTKIMSTPSDIEDMLDPLVE